MEIWYNPAFNLLNVGSRISSFGERTIIYIGVTMDAFEHGRGLLSFEINEWRKYTSAMEGKSVFLQLHSYRNCFIFIVMKVFCPTAGPSLQAQEPRLHFCRRQVYPANSGTKDAVLLVINMCGSFPLLSAHHSLFSIWTAIKRSEKIPGAPLWRWGEWIWLTGPSLLHKLSP